MDPALVAFGLGVGVLVGMTGIGGGSLMTPLLILVFGIKPVTAVGTDLAYGAVTKTLGGWRHFRQRTVFFPLAVWMGVGSVPAAVGGVYVLHMLEHRYGKSFDHAMLIAVAAAVMFTGVAVLSRALFMPRLLEHERSSFDMTTRDKVSAAVLGLFVGFVLGVTSAGSGTLIAVGLILIFRLVPTRVVGTDVFHAAVLLWAAGLAQLAVGNIDFGLMGTILIGSLPGVLIGERLSHRIPAAALRPALGCVMLASALGIFTKAGLDVPAGVIIGLPLAVGATTDVLTWARQRQDVARLATTSSP
jgi:uncharacterized protein